MVALLLFDQYINADRLLKKRVTVSYELVNIKPKITSIIRNRHKCIHSLVEIMLCFGLSDYLDITLHISTKPHMSFKGLVEKQAPGSHRFSLRLLFDLCP